MSGIHLISPEVFVALGLSPEEARAEALQAERAAVFKAWGGAAVPPRRWFTHGVLPPDPQPEIRGRTWESSPWDDVTPVRNPYEGETFSTPLAWRILTLNYLCQRFARRDREDFFGR